MLKGIILKNLIEVGLVPGLGVIISASVVIGAADEGGMPPVPPANVNVTFTTGDDVCEVPVTPPAASYLIGFASDISSLAARRSLMRILLSFYNICCY